MKSSWKKVMLLALTFLSIQYITIWTLTSKPLLLWSLHNPQNCSLGETDPTAGTRKLHILVLATARGGSSFVGDLLNQHPEIFYLYEPLHHVYATMFPSMSFSPAERRVTLGASRDLLRSLYGCDLYVIENYINPPPENHLTEKLFRRGTSRALCQEPVCSAFGPGDANVDEWDCVEKCGSLNMTLAAEACHQRKHVAIKVIGVPEITDVQALVEDPRLNIKVIQLVRDPRAILSSRMETFRDAYNLWYTWKTTGKRPNDLDMIQLKVICEDFFGSVSTGLSHPHWLKGKYMLVRHEDLAINPLLKTQEIYDFLGLPMDKNVTNWILDNTQVGNKSSTQELYGTTRDSAATAESWRLNLPFDIVETTQTVCQKVLHQLGYKAVKSVEELKNMSISLVQDKNFELFLEKTVAAMEVS